MRTLTASFVVTLLLSSGAALAGAPPANPPLSHEEVKSTVDSHLGDVKACLKDHGAATGKLVVEFAIQPDGKVTEAKPKESSSNAALDKCIAKAFTHWTFPKPRGGVIMGVVYPFMFAPPPPPKAPPQGKLTPQQIVAVVKTKLGDIKGCYEGAAKEKEGLKGTVQVAVVVTPAGAVKEASVKQSDTGSPHLDQCVVAKVKSWSFPKPDGNAEAAFIYPFVFTPTNPDGEE